MNNGDNNLININFITPDNEKIKVKVEPGTSVLEAAHQNSLPLEGTCEGSLACSTCHVIMESEYFNLLDELEEEEQDMLDCAYAVTNTSRLGCQVIITKELEGATFSIPGRTRNISSV